MLFVVLMYRNKMIGFLFGFALGFLFMLNVTYSTYSLSQIPFLYIFLHKLWNL